MKTIISIEVTTDGAEPPRFFAHLECIDEDPVDVEIPEALLTPLVEAVANLGASILGAIPKVAR